MQFKDTAVLSVLRGGTAGVWRVDLAGQSASIAPTDLIRAGVVDGGIYVVKGVATVTTAAGTSSSLNVKINFTDADSSIAVAGTSQGFTERTAGLVSTPQNNSSNGDGIFCFTHIINATAGIAIQYQANYASNPAAAMIYSLHLVASRF